MHQVISRKFYLDAGTLTLETTFEQEDLFRIAERINPRRAFLFVSTVLGRHIPVDPLVHRIMLKRLSCRVSDHLGAGDVLVMGFAETAVGLAAGVHDCLARQRPDRQIGFLPTTRFAPGRKSIWFEIEESHSHAADHIILRPEDGILPKGPNRSLVLVDDETTSGATFAALSAGLKEAGQGFDHIVLATLTDWSDGRALQAVCSVFPDARVTCVSLQQGKWRWEQDTSAPVKTLPGPVDPACAPWPVTKDGPFMAPRTGHAGADGHLDGLDLLNQLLGCGLELPSLQDRVLVIGAGENVWAPMLVAEALAQRSILTRFITTTRSPIELGHAIRRKAVFADHYGAGFEMYMHNVAPSEWSRVLLFNETGAAGVPPALREALGTFDLIGPNGSVSRIAWEEEAA